MERSDSANIEIVTSSGESRSPDVRLVADLHLGGAEEGPQSFYRVSPAVVGVDAEGRIHVLRRDEGRIERFDAQGRHLGTIGRSGEGPGELTRPLSMAVEPDGTIHVFDAGHRGVVRFDSVGQAIPTLELPFAYWGLGMQAVEGAVWFESGDIVTGEARLVRLESGGDTTTLLSHTTPVSEPLRLESCGMGLPGLPPIFHPGLRWTASNDRMVAARGAAYDLEVWEDVREVRRIRRRIEPRPSTEAAAVASLGEGFRVGIPGGERICDPEEQVELRGFAPEIPLTGEMRLAPDGTLWVRHYGTTPDEEPAIDLFTPDGAYLGTLPPGTPFPVDFLPDGRVLWAETDELDVQRLVVGRLVESAEEEESP